MPQFKKIKHPFKKINKMDQPPLPYTRRPKTPTSGCCGDFWSKAVFLIFACGNTNKSCINFFLQKVLGIFWVSVFLSASVERISVSCMRDFWWRCVNAMCKLFCILESLLHPNVCIRLKWSNRTLRPIILEFNALIDQIILYFIDFL